MGEPISLRELARRLGVNDKAIRNGIASGRLKASIGTTAKGKPVVIDAALALHEWTSNASRAAKDASRGSSGSAAESAPPSAASASDNPPTPAKGAASDTNTLVAINAGVAEERRRKLKLENDVRQGRLVELEVVTREAFNAQRAVREAILNVPARLSGELAAEQDPAKVHIRLEAALREALQAAAMTIRQAAANE